MLHTYDLTFIFLRIIFQSYILSHFLNFSSSAEKKKVKNTWASLLIPRTCPTDVVKVLAGTFGRGKQAEIRQSPAAPASRVPTLPPRLLFHRVLIKSFPPDARATSVCFTNAQLPLYRPVVRKSAGFFCCGICTLRETG